MTILLLRPSFLAGVSRLCRQPDEIDVTVSGGSGAWIDGHQSPVCLSSCSLGPARVSGIHRWD